MSHRTLYLLVGGVFAVLLVVMLVTYDYDRSSVQADAKADDLIAAFEAAGLRTPADADQVARVLGTDGGVVCATAGDDLGQALIKLDLSVGGNFYTRPVMADRRVLEGALLIVETYCPAELDDVRAFVDGQDLAVVVRD